MMDFHQFLGKYWIKWDGNRVINTMLDELGTGDMGCSKSFIGDSSRNVQHDNLDSEGEPIVYEENYSPISCRKIPFINR